MYPLYKTQNIKRKALYCIAAAAFALLLIPASHAQTEPVVVMSWKAHTLTPDGYAGKALPSYQSEITVSADMIMGGELADLRNATFRWRLENVPHTSGRGLRTMTFPVHFGHGNAHWVRVQIDHLGTTYQKDLDILIHQPKVVVRGPSSDNTVRRGENLFTAFPYFFAAESMRDIAFSWTVGGNATQPSNLPDNQLLLRVLPDTQTGFETTIRVIAQNTRNIIQIARRQFSVMLGEELL